jgi:hypothetical protein
VAAARRGVAVNKPYGFLVVDFFLVLRWVDALALFALCVESFFSESAWVESAFFFVVSSTMPVSILGSGVLGAGVNVVAVSVDREPAAVSTLELREEQAPIAIANGTAAKIFQFPIIPTS